MFGNNKKESAKSKGSAIIPSAANNSLNSLVGGTVINGAVNSDSDIRIDGKIEGKLFCKAKVIIGPTGFVQGEIRCENAVIEGKFDGQLYVNDLLNIRESADIKGEVQTNKLIVQSGAAFNVSCQMGKVKPSVSNGAATSSSSNKENVKATKATSAN
jgi:cytoskeletal protein CcmA (bactofilin family)